MNAKTEYFIRQFPDSEIRQNCLVDLACPKCGSRDSIGIAAVKRITVDVSDDGHDDSGGDTEWDRDSWCQCNACEHVGNVGRFTFPGLDEELELRRHPTCHKPEAP